MGSICIRANACTINALSIGGTFRTYISKAKARMFLGFLQLITYNQSLLLGAAPDCKLLLQDFRETVVKKRKTLRRKPSKAGCGVEITEESIIKYSTPGLISYRRDPIEEEPIRMGRSALVDTPEWQARRKMEFMLSLYTDPTVLETIKIKRSLCQEIKNYTNNKELYKKGRRLLFWSSAV
ncbi:uncharacterized protein LOC144782821 [Lissotriton helveticus]